MIDRSIDKIVISNGEAIPLAMGSNLYTLSPSHSLGSQKQIDIHPDLANSISLDDSNELFAIPSGVIDPVTGIEIWDVNIFYLEVDELGNPTGDLNRLGKEVLTEARTGAMHYILALENAMIEYSIQSRQVIKVIDPSYGDNLGSDWELEQALFWALIDDKIEITSIYQDDTINLIHTGETVPINPADPSEGWLYESDGTLFWSDGIKEIRLASPGTSDGGLSIRVAFSQLQTDVPRPMLATPAFGGSRWSFGLTEFDVNPLDRPVNLELLHEFIELYNIPMMESYSMAKAILPESVFQGVISDGPLDPPTMPDERYLALGFDRYGTDQAGPDWSGNYPVPAEFSLWVRLGEEYEIRKLQGTELEWEEEILQNPPSGMFGAPVTNAEAYYAIMTPELKHLIHLRYQSILTANIAGLGIADFYHVFNTQPEMDGHVSNMLNNVISSPMVILDILATMRKSSYTTRGKNWDIINQAEVLQRMLEKHPEIGGGFESIIFEPLRYRANLLVVPENLADLKPDIVERAINTDYLTKLEDDFLETLSISGTASFQGESKAYNTVIIVGPDGRLPGSARVIDGVPVTPDRFTLGDLSQHAKDVVLNPKLLNEETNVLGQIMLNFIGRSEFLSSGDSEINTGTLEGIRKSLFEIMRTSENSYSELSSDSPSILNNDAKHYNNIFSHKRTKIRDNGKIEFTMDKKAGQNHWAKGVSTSARSFLIDWRYAFIADGFDDAPLFIKFPKQWADWLDGADVSNGGSPTYFDRNGEEANSVVVRMTKSYRGQTHGDINIEALIFREVTKALGIRPSYTVTADDNTLIASGLKEGDEISNLRKTLILHPEEFHLSIQNTMQSWVARNVRPYDTGSENAGMFNKGSDEVFDGWHPIENGMRISINENGNLIMDGDPQVVYGSLLPNINRDQWDAIRTNFKDADIDFSIGNFWGYILVANDAGNRHSGVRFRDFSADTEGLVDVGFRNIGVDADQFEDMGHYMAFIASPREETVTNFVTNGFSRTRPIPGIDPDDKGTDGNIPFIPWKSNYASFKAWATDTIALGGQPTLRYWSSDHEAQTGINWLNTVSGNYNQAPPEYVLAWLAFRTTFISWYFQLNGWMRLVDDTKFLKMTGDWLKKV